MAILPTILLKPSTYVRGLWIAVAALHAWLFVRRFVEGEWMGGMNQARLVLALAACLYGTVKVWRPATFLDASPQRAWAFALLLIVGHFGVSSENYRRIAANAAAGVEWDRVVLVTATVVVSVALVFLARLPALSTLNCAGIFPAFVVSLPALAPRTRHSARWQRPPPSA